MTFKHKDTGKWVNFVDGVWELSDALDEISAKENIYEFVNEIIADLKCNFDDIEIIDDSLLKLRNMKEELEISKIIENLSQSLKVVTNYSFYATDHGMNSDKCVDTTKRLIVKYLKELDNYEK